MNNSITGCDRRRRGALARVLVLRSAAGSSNCKADDRCRGGGLAAVSRSLGVDVFMIVAGIACFTVLMCVYVNRSEMRSAGDAPGEGRSLTVVLMVGICRGVT